MAPPPSLGLGLGLPRGGGPLPYLLDLSFLSSFPAQLTHSRASTGTYVNSSGLIASAAINAPRITHDPATLEPLGYLHEPSATNYVKYYNATNGNGNMSPADGSTTTANYGVAPNGNTETIRLADNSTLYGWGVALNNTELATLPANSTITGSVYLRKKSSSTYVGSIALYCSGGTVAEAITHLNYVTGVATSPSTAGPMSSASVKVTDAGDFWRVAITGTDGGSNTTARLLLYPSPRTTALVTDPTLTGECEYWGHQIELGSAATSLIPTSGASATRAADVVDPLMIGDGASSAGTFLLTAKPLGAAGNNYIIAAIYENSGQDYFLWDESANGATFRQVARSGNTTRSTASGSSTGGVFTLGMSWTEGGTAYTSYNGGAASSFSLVSNFVAPLDRFGIARNLATTVPGGSIIQRVRILPRAVDPATLQSLTT